MMMMIHTNFALHQRRIMFCNIILEQTILITIVRPANAKKPIRLNLGVKTFAATNWSFKLRFYEQYAATLIARKGYQVQHLSAGFIIDPFLHEKDSENFSYSDNEPRTLHEKLSNGYFAPPAGKNNN